MRGWLTIALSLAVASQALAVPPWEQISDDDGIVVWQRDVPGTSLVEFRGRGLVEAPLKKILAVLRDQKRKTEWMANCAENHLLETPASNRMIIYSRVRSPALFVSDRDIVYDASARYDVVARSVTLTFEETRHDEKPPLDDVVRMPKVRGLWHLQVRGPSLVDVTYQVAADPGGWLPSWLVNWASTDIPRHSLAGLRRQVKKTGYDEDLRAIEAAIDWRPFEGAPAGAVTSSTSVSP